MKVKFNQLNIKEIEEIPSKLDPKILENMSLGERAELWCKDHGWDIPVKGTNQWQEMYELFIEWAFAKLIK